jgi:hypothetical protein
MQDGVVVVTQGAGEVQDSKREKKNSEMPSGRRWSRGREACDAGSDLQTGAFGGGKGCSAAQCSTANSRSWWR